MPAASSSPFGRDEQMPMLGVPRDFSMMSPRQQQYASKLHGSEQSVAYIETNRHPKNNPTLNTTWRTGDLTPFALDNSPRGPRAMPVTHVARDPDLAGYGSKGTAGYGSEMLFGFKSPERPNLDLQVAQWRLGPGTNDPNPFTIDGSVPAPSPRRDPGRKLQRELMVQFSADDTIAREAARGEMARYVRGVERYGGVDFNSPSSHHGEQMGLFPTHRETRDPSAPKQSNGNWRLGDKHPLTLDGEIIPARARNPVISSSWRQYDKSGIAGVLNETPREVQKNWREPGEEVQASPRQLLTQNKSSWRLGADVNSSYFAPTSVSPPNMRSPTSRRGGGDSSSEASPSMRRPQPSGPSMARLLPGLVSDGR